MLHPKSDETYNESEMTSIQSGVEKESLHTAQRESTLPSRSRGRITFFGIFAVLFILLLGRNCNHRSFAGSRSPTYATPCDTPFGSLIGTSVVFHVPAFSNCNSDMISDISNFVNTTTVNGTVVLDVFSGMQWQCVEYARRTWLTSSPSRSFGSVNGASDIWSLPNAILVTPTGSPTVTVPLYKFPNGNTTVLPQKGDLMIYPIQPGGFPFGHVAVVVGMIPMPTPQSDRAFESWFVLLAEQNWDSYPWAFRAKGYSRQLVVTKAASSQLVVVDDPQGTIQGWVRS